MNKDKRNNSQNDIHINEYWTINGQQKYTDKEEKTTYIKNNKGNYEPFCGFGHETNSSTPYRIREYTIGFYDNGKLKKDKYIYRNIFFSMDNSHSLTLTMYADGHQYEYDYYENPYQKNPTITYTYDGVKQADMSGCPEFLQKIIKGEIKLEDINEEMFVKNIGKPTFSAKKPSDNKKSPQNNQKSSNNDNQNNENQNNDNNEINENNSLNNNNNSNNGNFSQQQENSGAGNLVLSNFIAPNPLVRTKPSDNNNNNLSNNNDSNSLNNNNNNNNNNQSKNNNDKQTIIVVNNGGSQNNNNKTNSDQNNNNQTNKEEKSYIPSFISGGIGVASGFTAIFVKGNKIALITCISIGSVSVIFCAVYTFYAYDKNKKVNNNNSPNNKLNNKEQQAKRN